MNLTPQIESILTEMTKLCCEALGKDGELDTDRLEELAESLSANGWERHSDGEGPLSRHLEDRIKQECPGAKVSGGVSNISTRLSSRGVVG